MRHRKKAVLLMALFVLLTLTLNPKFHDLLTHIYHQLYPKEGIQCFRAPGPTLPHINPASVPPNGAIFFHETSCDSFFAGAITITARQACAVESAALLNPNRLVYLLYASPGQLRLHRPHPTASDRFLAALTSYANVRINHINYERYTNNTPLAALYQTGAIDDSGYAKSHASDVLRYLTLWKFGGLYLDLDVVLLKSVEQLAPNFAGYESPGTIAAGVLSFDAGGPGHEMARRCLLDLKGNFRGHEWGTNGPGVITRVLKEVCEVDAVLCRSFRVYQPHVFYPVRWRDWKRYFTEGDGMVEELVRDSVAVHVWNKHSGGVRIPVGGNVPYLRFAQKYCPKVYGQCDVFF